MRVVRPATIDEWIRLATPFLVEHEAEHGILLGVAMSTPSPKPEAYWALVMDGERVVAAGLRTSERLIVSREAAAGAIACLATEAMSPATHAVLGPKAEAAAFVAATPYAWTKGMAQRVYELRTVVAQPPSPGAHRLAGPDDRDVLADWVCSFHDEATNEGFQRDAVERKNDHHIATGAFHVWEDDGRLVACTVAVGRTPNGIRINTVYTPPELRGRGYGGSLVAAVCQYLLDGGRKFVLLHADLDNPTSNRLYSRVGFRPVGDADDFIRER